MNIQSTKALIGNQSNPSPGERGAALLIALLMMILLSAIAIGVLAVVQGNAKIAGSDLNRTQACYASAAAMEIMTNNFSTLFAHTSRPSQAELDYIEEHPPTELTTPTDPANIAYTFPDHDLDKLPTPTPSPRPSPVTIPYGPFSGLIAGRTPYRMTTTAQSQMAQCKLTRDVNNYLIPLFQFGMFSDKDIELHPGPAFTFNGRVHANGNIYVHGSVKFLDRVTTANELITDVLRNGSTRDDPTVSMEVAGTNVPLTKGSMNLGPNLLTADDDPVGQRGYNPGSPTGTFSTTWDATSIAAATGVANRFGGQLLTRSTGAAQLKLPLQLDGSPTRELIKRRVTNDNPVPTNPSALSESRYHSKAEIRILIDDEMPVGVDTSGIPVGEGVALSTFTPDRLPNTAADTSYTANGGGRALWPILDTNRLLNNSYDTAATIIRQQQNGTAAIQADTVRGVRAPVLRAITLVAKTTGNPITVTAVAHGFVSGDWVRISSVGGATSANNSDTNTYWQVALVSPNIFTLNSSSSTSMGTYTSGGTVHKLTRSSSNTVIPYGAGLTGRILIQIVDNLGVERDVTRQILSMGVTEGEPNSIVQLQRPLWAAFTQGSRDSSVLNGTNNLTNILNNTLMGADGEIRISGSNPILDTNGFLKAIIDEATPGVRSDVPPSNSMASLMAAMPNTNGSDWATWNAIVPINVYNMREGHLSTAATQDRVYERGITSVVQLNMRNVARWVEGVFDSNLLAGTSAVSANIDHPDGYIVYVSDRRGDKVKSQVVANPGSKPKTFATFTATNGMVDNVDIYGQNNVLDPGEDVQNTGLNAGTALAGVGLRDLTELPDPAQLVSNPDYGGDDLKRAIAVAAWQNLDPVQPLNHRYFRSAVRIFNGENLQVAGSVGRLTNSHGITVSTENMVYIWGNYNTTGINEKPDAGESSLNSPSSESRYCPGTGTAGTACDSLVDTQVPSSIVADSFFPMSKTWFDAEAALYPQQYTTRRADRDLPGGNAGEKAGTAVRAGIIAGNNLGAVKATGGPDAGNGDDARLNGGMHNFPRFLEDWLVSPSAANLRRWNFVGSFIPLYNSTQGMGQWWYIKDGDAIYGAPQRNWAFDETFLQMERLPPGTPMFQYISPSAFRQVL